MTALLVWRGHIPGVIRVPIGIHGLPGRHHVRMSIVVLRRHEGTVVRVHHHHMTWVTCMMALIHVRMVVRARHWCHMVVMHNGLCVM